MSKENCMKKITKKVRKYVVFQYLVGNNIGIRPWNFNTYKITYV